MIKRFFCLKFSIHLPFHLLPLSRSRNKSIFPFIFESKKPSNVVGAHREQAPPPGSVGEKKAGPAEAAIGWVTRRSLALVRFLHAPREELGVFRHMAGSCEVRKAKKTKEKTPPPHCEAWPMLFLAGFPFIIHGGEERGRRRKGTVLPKPRR